MQQQQQTTGLYVGNLDEGVSTDMLYTFFFSYEIINIHHPFDHQLKKHKTFAFVYFHTPEKALKAQDEKNHEKIMLKPVRLMPIINVGQLDPLANIYIKNMDPVLTQQEFDVFFKKFGKVVTSVLRFKDNGESLCYGYVQYQEQGSAKAAIDECHGKKLKECIMHVELFKPKSNRRVNTVKTNLYIKNLPDGEIEPVKLRVLEVFGKYGEITSTALKVDSNIKKAFGFINYKTHEEAEKAFKELNGADPFKISEPLYINWAQSKYERMKIMKERFKITRNVTKLYIRSLKPDTTAEGLKTIFSQFGTVEYFSVRDHTRDNVKMKFGFIQFATSEGANKAMGEAPSNDDVLSISLASPAYIKFAQSREMRNKFLKTQRLNKKAHGQTGVGQRTSMMQNLALSNPQTQMLLMMMQQLMNGAGLQNFQGFQGQSQGTSGRYNGYRGNHRRGNNNYHHGHNNQRRNYHARQNMNMPQHHQPMNQILQPQQQRMPQQDQHVQPVPQKQKKSPTIEQVLEKWEYFQSIDRTQQRNVMGEVIYPFVMKINQQFAPKITGMLIDLDPTELKSCLDDQQKLVRRINEAAKMLTVQEISGKKE